MIKYQIINIGKELGRKMQMSSEENKFSVSKKPFYKLISAVGVTTGSRIITGAMSFGLQIILVQTLSKADFGLIATFSAVSSYFFLLGDFSTNSIAQINIVNNKNAPQDAYNCFFTTKLLTTIIATILFVITTFILGYSMHLFIVVVIALSIVLTSLTTIPQLLLTSFSLFSRYNMVLIGTTILVVTFQVCALLLMPSITSYYAGFLVGNILAVVLGYFITGKSFAFIYSVKRVKYKCIKNLLKASLPLCIGSFFYLLHYRINTIVVSKIAGLEAAGDYNFSWMLMNLIVDILWVQFIIVYNPKMVVTFNASKTKLIKELYLIILGYFCIFTMATFFIYFFGGKIISVISDKYAASSKLLFIMFPTAFFIAIFGLFYRVLILANKQFYYVYIVGGCAIFNIVCSLPLVGKHGAAGAAVASLITQAAGTLACYFVCYKLVFKTAEAVKN